MDYGPDIPTAVEREIFAKPPLKAMIGQIRFPPVLRINDLALLAAYQDAVRSEFPEYAPEQQLNVVLGPAGPQNATVGPAYRFSTSDLAWSILVTSESLSLEVAVAERYTNYDEFMQRFELGWSALLQHFPPNRVTRQGLRYVDHIEGDLRPAEWARYINADLLGPLIGAFGSGVEQAVSELRFNRDDGVLVFKHGMIPAGPEGTKGYLLDFDYYNEDSTPETSVASVVERFDRFHDLQYAFFRWCVTEEAIEGFRRGD